MGFAPFVDSLPVLPLDESAQRLATSGLLALLVGGPLTLSELQKQIALPFPQFSRALNFALDAMFVALRGAPGHEIVGLTAKGAMQAQKEEQ